ncbi:hypothetical protein ACLH0D_20805, partial [Aeromonas media]
HVNGYHRRLKEWMERFHGVATSYLKHYLGWRRMLERYQRGIDVRCCLHEALGCVLKMLVFCPSTVPVSNEGRKPA